MNNLCKSIMPLSTDLLKFLATDQYSAKTVQDYVKTHPHFTAQKFHSVFSNLNNKARLEKRGLHKKTNNDCQHTGYHHICKRKNSKNRFIYWLNTCKNATIDAEEEEEEETVVLGFSSDEEENEEEDEDISQLNPKKKIKLTKDEINYKSSQHDIEVLKTEHLVAIRGIQSLDTEIKHHHTQLQQVIEKVDAKFTDFQLLSQKQNDTISHLQNYKHRFERIVLDQHQQLQEQQQSNIEFQKLLKIQMTTFAQKINEHQKQFKPYIDKQIQDCVHKKSSEIAKQTFCAESHGELSAEEMKKLSDKLSNEFAHLRICMNQAFENKLKEWDASYQVVLLGYNWDNKCDQLCRFFDKNKRLPSKLSEDIEERSLHDWLRHQKQLHHMKRLDSGKVEKIKTATGGLFVF